ncbi:MAG: class I SAM-dependent methyltransferase [Dongiaceae bacterium]
MIGTEEYDDPVRYDAEYGGIDEDGAFFLRLAEACGQRLLDLGCGTGRLAIPLAQRGKQVTGLDGSAAMLAHAQRKAPDLPIRWMAGDFRHYDLGRKFDLIISCAHAFQALLTEADRLAFLRCAQAHLAEGGILSFDTRNTVPLHLDVSGRECFWHSFALPGGGLVEVSGIEAYDAATGIMHYRTFRTRRDSGLRTETVLDIKFTAPDDLRRLLQVSGLREDRMFGDFSGGPLTDASPEIVVIARSADAGQSEAVP